MKKEHMNLALTDLQKEGVKLAHVGYCLCLSSNSNHKRAKSFLIYSLPLRFLQHLSKFNFCNGCNGVLSILTITVLFQTVTSQYREVQLQNLKRYSNFNEVSTHFVWYQAFPPTISCPPIYGNCQSWTLKISIFEYLF